MEVRDNYDNVVHPGDTICCVHKKELRTGQVCSISPKGKLRVKFWNQQFQNYWAKVELVTTWRFIKITGTAKNPEI